MHRHPISISLLKFIHALFALRDTDATSCQDIIAYLVRHNFYARLKTSVEKIVSDFSTIVGAISKAFDFVADRRESLFTEPSVINPTIPCTIYSILF